MIQLFAYYLCVFTVVVRVADGTKKRKTKGSAFQTISAVHRVDTPTLHTRSPANAGRPRDAVSTYRSPRFCFPWRRPCNNHAICCTDGKDNSMLAKRLAACTYLYSIVSLKSMRKSKNRHFTTFLFPLGRPWRNHAKCCMDRKKIRCLQIASLHVPI